MSTSSLVRTQERFDQLWGPRQHLQSNMLYILPSDHYEQERLRFEQHALKISFGRNYFAPLVRPMSILDTGCGLGFWAFDMCRAFPQARVIGFDISASQLPNPPSNYLFFQGSILQPLPFADQSFDYVHQRLMWATIPGQRWRSILAELVRITAPGGYIELVEIAPGLETMGPATALLASWVSEAELRCEIDLRLVLHLPTLLDLAGAVTFFQRVIWLPLGEGHGHGGRLLEQNTSAFFASLASFAQEHLSLTLTEYQRAWCLMREEWTQRRIMCPFVITLAQKPTHGQRSRFTQHLGSRFTGQVGSQTLTSH